MAAASARERSTSAGQLSIGAVLGLLSPEFPALSGSKLRYLEVQGIVTPSRTPSGYRKFTPDDVDRLRLALTLQRDHYLPLSVIRQYLDDRDAGNAPVLPTPQRMHPQHRRYSRADLLAAAGAAPQLLNDAISTGVIVAHDTYPESAVTMLRSLVALDRHGIEPRHVRVMRQSAEREVALVEAALTPLLRKVDAGSRARADELAPELVRRLDEVREQFVTAALQRMLST